MPLRARALGLCALGKKAGSLSEEKKGVGWAGEKQRKQVMENKQDIQTIILKTTTTNKISTRKTGDGKQIRHTNNNK